MAFVKKFLEAPNKFENFLHSDFLKTADQLSKGINSLKPIDPNLSKEQQKQQQFKNVLAGTLGSAAINFLPRLAGFKKGGRVKKTKAKKKPKTKAKKKANKKK